jgi:ribosomal protein S18 acetylase RimI-like enzyme
MEQLLITSFPPEEYREPEQLRQNTDHTDNFYNCVLLDDHTPIGICSYWSFARFYYIEHLAIAPQLRNKGYGADVLQLLCRELAAPIVLEVEQPDTPLAERRIRFYHRNGFTLWEHPYLQPPYREGDGYLPMWLMSHGNLACEHDFDEVRQTLYKEVYNVKGEKIRPDGRYGK